MSDDLDPTVAPEFDELGLLALSAFVDGELPEAERRAMAERLADDARAADVASHYRAQRAALRALFADPAAQSNGPCVVLRVRARWWRRAAFAGGALAAGVALGWLGGAVAPQFAPEFAAPAAAQTAFARQANLAYAVYAPDARYPVEIAAGRDGTLAAWLSARIGRRIVAPSLDEYGFALLGGRLLPGAAGPAAQFMYESPAGGRLALYVSASAQHETAVKLLRDGERRTFYWVSDHTAYALSGQLAEDRLRAIAVDVCGELGGHPDRWR
ncbi:anti-sigma factor family protein [Burkholderia mayonis]|uniref:Anti-sigma factor n=1 Tax=Burkholderia mayonis TaxID=1385591 RepID=A0A1B4FTW1_9BURK|nr:anti-sigma factor [Burkholderia mayonis]AOJ07110.1 anti-sigma factor [Burkholderia mayonis]KVE45992.1 anti-sigma factor [Burkholderia mayonis]